MQFDFITLLCKYLLKITNVATLAFSFEKDMKVTKHKWKSWLKA